MINKVTEVVGIGHPDKLADRISDFVRKLFETAGIETMVRHNHLDNLIHVAIFGDIQLKDGSKLRDVEREIKETLDKFLTNIWEEYHVDHEKQEPIKIEYYLVFCPQNPDLNSRSKTGLSGDQEVVYRTVHTLHNNLKEVSNKLSEKFPVLDWKLLVNTENKIINFSCSTSCHNYKQKDIENELISNLKIHNYYKNYQLHYCWFEGGSIFNDVGVTGRKLVFDGDGCGAPHGGGAWSGKDITKAAVVGREYLEKHNIEGAAVYIPKQWLDKPTIIKGRRYYLQGIFNNEWSKSKITKKNKTKIKTNKKNKEISK